MNLGTTGTAEIIVTDNLTAKKMGSGDLPVFATPAMIALMEKAANTSMAPFLEAGQGTVGISIDVSHLAPSPVGSSIYAKSVLVSIEKRVLTFEVSAFCNNELIGKGFHKRAIIDNAKFMSKIR